MHPNLPAELVEFLGRGGQFDYDPSECEPGDVRLKRLSEITLGEVWVGTDTPGDPNAGEDGYYSIPAVSLTGDCAAYDPEFILLWLPNETQLGTWDCDHGVLMVFPEATWSAVVANPTVYINAQWEPDPVGAVLFEPWHQYVLRPGRPS